MPTLGVIRTSLSMTLIALFSLVSLAAEPPTGKAVLTVSGNISQTNSGDRFVFDMAMLAQLPQHSFTTHTPWHSGPHRFTGPLLRDLLAEVGANGTTLKAIALNDYKVEIPVTDSTSFNVIVARLMNDKAMPVRHKGPLFIIYPFDQDRGTRTQVHYNRSIWQLKAIRVE